MAQETLTDESPPSYQSQRTHSPNVLIVGETGVGKSSVINLIADEPLADVSSSASGCTMEAASYDIILRDQHVRLFDTVGLNEPSMSKNDYLTAIEKANLLITQLWRTGGIRLLILCIRGGRITSVTQSNYHLFRYILCQNQVPIAFVITGMETEQPMEAWWGRNEHVFERANLFCDSHVCVTAIRGLNNVYNSQYKESQSAIHNMLLGHMSRPSWKPDRTNSWFIHLAGVLWARVAKDMQRNERAKDLKVEELVRRLEDKCRFSREEAEVLAGKIWAKRTETIEKVDGARVRLFDSPSHLSHYSSDDQVPVVESDEEEDTDDQVQVVLESDEEEDTNDQVPVVPESAVVLEEGINAWWIDERFGPDSCHCISLPIFS